MEFGIVTHIQRYSIHDGPGIRTTVFLKGCPLACVWCHNPEGMNAGSEIVVVETRCVRCGECVEVCPERQGDEDRGDEDITYRLPSCTTCGACVAVCPTGARQLVGRRMSVADVTREAMKDRVFYDEGGGGVTFSGGEPLAQAPFLLALLERCRAEEIHSAVDTCGAAAREDLVAAARLADLFLYDIKTLDDARHTEFTGCSNVSLLDNLRALGEIHSDIWIRVPVIPGLNDRAEDLAPIARLAAAMRGVRQLCLLPYHTTGVAKFRRLGREYRLADVRPPPREAMEALASDLVTAGVAVRIGG